MEVVRDTPGNGVATRYSFAGFCAGICVGWLANSTKSSFLLCPFTLLLPTVLPTAPNTRKVVIVATQELNDVARSCSTCLSSFHIHHNAS